MCDLRQLPDAGGPVRSSDDRLGSRLLQPHFAQARGASICGGVFGAAAGLDSSIGGGNGVAMATANGWAAGALHSP